MHLRNGFLASITCTTLVLLSACMKPPYNNLKPHSSVFSSTAAGTGVGALAGLPAVGGAIGALAGGYKDSQAGLINQLQRQDVQVVRYGDTMTLVIPTDKFFVLGTDELNELCYPALNNILRLVNYHKHGPLYIAGFTDDIGSKEYKKNLTQHQAQAIKTFLWANGIDVYRLNAVGYSDKYDIANNHLIHGSAFNRRIELQWKVLSA